MPHVIRNNGLEEIGADDNDIQYEMLSPARQFSNNINSVPLQGNVQPPRLFYASRFQNQALSILNGEAPLVQNLDPEDKRGRSFDEIFGVHMGARRAKRPGQVTKLSPGAIRVRYDDDGSEEDVELYRDMPFNQKSGITSRALVKAGDRFDADQMLAASNYTDDNGVVNMGLNARVGLVPWMGNTMDDALAVSESFAQRMRALQYKTMKQDRSEHLKTGLTHFTSAFPNRFPKEILANFNDDGMVKPGTILREGDPILLATKPKTLSSSGASIGRLSKVLQQQREDAAMLWKGSADAEVIDARSTKNGFKIVLKYSKPIEPGDKVDFRQGGKGTVSKIIPDERMPRTMDGQPLEVMLNPLSLVSRANPATALEIRLGKAAKALGRPIKLPSYMPNGEDMGEVVKRYEQEAGVESKEQLFDPETNRPLAAPVTVGYGFMNRLHHTAESKGSDRGVAGYDQNEQPLRGGHSDGAQAKRFSGLENAATMAAGAYALLKENSTLRGQRNDQFWRDLRAGKATAKPGVPFVFKRFRHLLAGGGVNTRDLGNGRIGLAPFTDRDLDEHDPVDIENGELVDTRTMDPIKGGLFDPRIITGNKWGRIRLPRPVPNPAYSEAIRTLLGLTKNEMNAILRGEADLPPKLQQRLGLDKAVALQ